MLPPINQNQRQRDQHAVSTIPCMTHERIRVSLSVFLLLLRFVLILKAWHWQINNLSLGFQMSQQSLSSHADVSVGSDVCNSIGARRECNSGLWPLARALHPLISHETWCKATEFKRCQASRTSEQSCRRPQCAPWGTRVTNYVPLRDVGDCFCCFCDFIFLFLFSFLRHLAIYLHLSVCLLVRLSFMVERACLWLSCRPQTIPPIFIPFHHNPSQCRFYVDVFTCYKKVVSLCAKPHKQRSTTAANSKKWKPTVTRTHDQTVGYIVLSYCCVKQI